MPLRTTQLPNLFSGGRSFIKIFGKMCYCGCSNQTGAVSVAVIQFVLAIVHIVLLSINYFDFSWEFVTLIFSSGFTIFMALVLAAGASTRNAYLIRIWLGWEGFIIIFSIIMVVGTLVSSFLGYTFLFEYHANFFGFGLTIIFHCFFVFGVFNLNEELRIEANKESFMTRSEIKTREPHNNHTPQLEVPNGKVDWGTVV
ncbi:hypothetical protein Ocin01_07119 [Orchesella cincta]|uniref:Uncharacterized protein n=1 Tax=Orchesella cincta TaxID=48709 RepID=A0A1D2N2P7_ORCCI|nr:hypothetical protein Ocin01_07119 [Orchesella cincta]